MDEISIEKARAKLGDLVNDAQDGITTVITRSGRPAAIIAPLTMLIDRDRDIVARARHLASLPTGAVREFTGEDDGRDAFIAAFVRAQLRLDELLAIIARLDGQAPAQATEDNHG